MMAAALETPSQIDAWCRAGGVQYVDLRPRVVPMPMLEKRSEHNPSLSPRDIYDGLEYSWHGLYAIFISRADFQDAQLQVLFPLQLHFVPAGTMIHFKILVR